MAISTTLTFMNHRKPRLMAGLHEIKVSQTVEHLPPGVTETGTEQEKWELAGSFEHGASFYVTAPRWRIAEDQIDRIFPAPGSKGDYRRSFPYVLIDNPTLPWERSPYSVSSEPEITPGNPAADTPWLVLAAFHESMIEDTTRAPGEPAGKPVRLGQATPATWADSALVATPSLNKEPTDSPDTTLKVVDIAAALAVEKGLSAERATQHACVVRSPGASAPGKADEHALISCPERVEPGRYQLLLLSLEGWLDRTSGGLVDVDETITHRRFICLGQWSFTCAAGENASFTEIAGAVDVGLLVDPNVGGDLHCKAGGRLLTHIQHNGVTTSSWRRGPLVPARIEPPADLDPWRARSAEELMLDVVDNGYSDASYAEAWEQGRLAALRKPILSAALADCRRVCAQQATDTDHLFCGEQRAPHPDLPSEWLSALLRLEYTPYTSLVPAESLLPAEKLRFFLIDPHWLECFLAGAVSLGRPFASRDCERMEHNFGAMLNAVEGRPVSGILLRSRLVAGWPELEVFGEATRGEVEPVRLSRPAPNILMALFADEIRGVTVSPPPHHLHLEDRDTEASGPAKWAAANSVVKELARFSMSSSQSV